METWPLKVVYHSPIRAIWKRLLLFQEAAFSNSRIWIKIVESWFTSSTPNAKWYDVDLSQLSFKMNALSCTNHCSGSFCSSLYIFKILGSFVLFSWTVWKNYYFHIIYISYFSPYFEDVFWLLGLLGNFDNLPNLDILLITRFFYINSTLRKTS